MSSALVRSASGLPSNFSDSGGMSMAEGNRSAVEARCLMAMKLGRNWLNIRTQVLAICGKSEFATEALYAKPITKTPTNWEELDKRDRYLKAPKNWPRGFTIRFVEMVLSVAGHFDIEQAVVYEDEFKRVTTVWLWDLCTNLRRSRSVTTIKVKERASVKDGDEVLATRVNSKNNTVYILPSTPAEVDLAEAANVSKAIRTLGEAMLPVPEKLAWREELEKTIALDAKNNPTKVLDDLVRSFSEFGIMPTDLETFLGRTIQGKTLQPIELMQLRTVLVALSNGEASYEDAKVAMETLRTGSDPKDLPKAASTLAARIVDRVATDRGKINNTAAASPTQATTAPPTTEKAADSPSAPATATASRQEPVESHPELAQDDWDQD